MNKSTVYRLIVDGKYIDYFFTFKHAERAAKAFEGQVIEIIEDQT